jgi:ABC-type branched-subunit amino acid transport system substrate-binding protein
MHQTTRRQYLATAATGVAGLAGCLGVGESADPVTIGSLLPLSGPGVLGDVAAHHEQAVAQAVEHVNAAGGIEGREVVHESRDTEASPAAATDAYDALADADAVAIVGAVISGISESLAPKAADDQRVLVSPSSTSPALATAGTAGDLKYFGRTCPNDRQQATAMAKILDDRRYADASTVGILHLDDAFGTALAEAVSGAVSADVTDTVAFAPSSTTPADPVDAVLADEPDAVAFAGTPGQSTAVLEELVGRRDSGEVVLSSGLLPAEPSNEYMGVFTASVADARTVGTKRLTTALSDIAPLMPYTTNAYDAAMLAALAAESAGDASPQAIARSLRAVSSGEGHAVGVGQFERARDVFDAGRSVNYRGASGAVDLQPNLEPLAAYVVERVRGGQTETLELLQRSFFGGERA